MDGLRARPTGSAMDDLEGGSGLPFSTVAYSHSTWNPIPALGVLAVVTAFGLLVFRSISHIILVLGVATYGLIFAFWLCRCERVDDVRALDVCGVGSVYGGSEPGGVEEAGACSTHRSGVGCVLCGGVIVVSSSSGRHCRCPIGAMGWNECGRGEHALCLAPPVHSWSSCRALSPFTRTAHEHTRGHHAYML